MMLQTYTRFIKNNKEREERIRKVLKKRRLGDLCAQGGQFRPLTDRLTRRGERNNSLNDNGTDIRLGAE